jgi:phosphate transport system permease protein
MASFRRARRSVVSGAFTGFCWVVTAIALAALALILWSLLVKGVGGIDQNTFTMDTPAAGSVGGLRNAIVGSVIMCGCAMVIAIFVGVLAGTWLAEYGRNSLYANIIRFLNDILLSAPSVLVGLFVYEFMVAPFHGFSAIAGSFALALIAVPIITRTTEDVLKLQPVALRIGRQRHPHRGPAGLRAHQRRNRAAALHLAQRTVSQLQPDQGNGQPAGGDLQRRPQRL